LSPEPVPAAIDSLLAEHAREIARFKELERTIEKVAQEWRSTFDAASDVIILLDDRRRVARANRAAVTFFGRSFAELLWQPVTELLAELEPRGSLRLPDVRRLRRRFEREVYLERPGVWVLLSLDPIRDKAGKPTGAVYLIRDITERKRAEIADRESLDQLRNLSARLEAAREQERTRIAREIHDELGHALTVLKMDSAWLAERIGIADPSLTERAHAMSALIERTIGTIRQIATELRPSILDDLGLLAALEWEGAELGRRTGINTRVRGPREPPALDDEHATAIFRIFQEALTNVARHSGAKTVRATLSKTEKDIVLEVIDDGSGFEPAALANPRSLGIVGMRERARILGGTLHLEGRPGAGARLWVTIPLGASPPTQKGAAP
jgi:PAS domain S-box-containing protein